MTTRSVLTLSLATLAVAAPASAANVRPTIGGDQVKMPMQDPGAAVTVRMKHADVGFDGQSIVIHVDESVPTPRLRTLSPPNTFDPAAAWSVLIGTHHNAQYGWNPSFAGAPLPPGMGVYIEQLDATPGLEVYEGGRFLSTATIDAMTFDPLFMGAPTTGDDAWLWESGQMTHHFFAVEDPTQKVYEATYRVYLADPVTGVEPMVGGVPEYGSATATFRWIAVPEPGAAALALGCLLSVIGTRRRTGSRASIGVIMPLVLAAMVTHATATRSAAAYSQPQLGGGSVSEAGAAMKHAFVFLDGFEVRVEIDPSIPAPRFRPLIEPNEFDPARPEAVLSGKAYNAQYGWLVGDFWSIPPVGARYWIEQVAASPGLEAYQAATETPIFGPVFGTAGSSMTWKWSTTTMVHNWYAVPDHTTQQHWAEYRVYVGNEVTGTPLPGYAAATTKFWFAKPGDFDNDGLVDVADYDSWRTSHGRSGPNLAADANGDGVVNAADYTVWRDRQSEEPPPGGAVPEPTTTITVAMLAAWVAAARRRPPR